MTIKANESKTIHLDPGKVLNLVCPSVTTGSVVRLSDSPGGEPAAPVAISSANLSFGPYTAATRFLVSVSVGTVTESIGAFDPKAGSTLGTDAAAGQVGEIITASVAAASGVSLTTNTAKDVTTITLTPGDWDVTGAVGFTPGATTSITQLQGSASLTQDTSGTFDATGQQSNAAQVPGANDSILDIPVTRFNVTSNTTIHLVAKGVFTISTLKAYGYLRARRVR